MKKLIVLLIAIFLILFTITAEARDITSGTIMILGDTSLNDSSVETKSNVLNDETDTTELNLTGAYFFGIRKTDSDVDLSLNTGGGSVSAEINETTTGIGLSVFF